MDGIKSTSELWGEVLVKVKELEKESRKTRLLMKETSDMARAARIRVNATKKKNGGLRVIRGGKES